MPAMIECVPNFSEGRRKEVINKIVSSIRSVPGIKILDVESDPDHNRSVVTFVGTEENIGEAAFQGAKTAVQLIDLNKHTGQHPRMGALDVLPFIPLGGATMQDCIEIANKVGERLALELRTPVYLYEEAAKKPERRNLEDVRRGQFEGIREAIKTDSSRIPDYGPRAVHPTGGATAVGARMPLVAFNVDLRTQDVNVAKEIAKKIRTSSGGLPYLKALGFYLAERKMTQVSMNLTNYKVTSMSTVFEAIRMEADARGVEIAQGEIIGLVPLDAICDLAGTYIKQPAFTSNQVLEMRIWG